MGLGVGKRPTFLEEERSCVQARGLERPQNAGVVERNSVPLKAAVCICGSQGGGVWKSKALGPEGALSAFTAFPWNLPFLARENPVSKLPWLLAFLLFLSLFTGQTPVFFVFFFFNSWVTFSSLFCRFLERRAPHPHILFLLYCT